jgi:hypothetical protein
MRGKKVVERKEKPGSACDKGTLEKNDGQLLKRLAGQNAKHHPGPSTNPDCAKDGVNEFENYEDHGPFLSTTVTSTRYCVPIAARG